MKRGLLIGVASLGCALFLGACSAAATATPVSTATVPAATAAPTSAPPGGLDTAFGTGGVIATPLSKDGHDRFLDAKVDKDGNLLAAGWVQVSGDNRMAL